MNWAFDLKKKEKKLLQVDAMLKNEGFEQIHVRDQFSSFCLHNDL